MQEFSFLFMTHRLNVMHALVKFHEYTIPYGLGVMVQTHLNLLSICKSTMPNKYQFLFLSTYNAFSPMTVIVQIKIQKG